MENYSSPLQKYKRQPKLYIDLPSKGVWYPKHILEKGEELEVYSMTANDEINIKTPDALVTGVAVKKLVESCVPAIKDGWYVPVQDLDYILSAIRLATYGPTIEMTTTCKECNNQDTYALPIQKLLDHLQAAKQNYEIKINEFVFRLRPLTYKELTEYQLEAFRVRRTIQQKIGLLDDSQEKEDEIRSLYESLRERQKSTVCNSIIEVITPEGESETKQEFIQNFIMFGDKEYFNALESLYEQNQQSLNIPQTEVECSSCKTKTTVQPDLDYSNFFDQR